ncbi:MAG: hypothetical protein QOG05_5055 [Streptosporangiaceae bacterium]|nr:hypothetical protein [Streptosporangiaceae bacterium]
MALAGLELDDGAEEDDRIAPGEELLVPDDELLLPELPEVEWDEEDPEVDLAEALWVELGRVKASPPATARPRTPVPAVTARSRPRARSRFTTAVTVRGSLRFIMSPSRKLTPPTFRNGLWLGFPLHLRQL